MENSYETVRAEPSIPSACRNDRVEKDYDTNLAIGLSGA